MKLAAIDIGSNAARLLISEAQPGAQGRPEFIKLSLVRVPLRLGFDVFEKGEISAEKTDMLIKTILSYKLLLDVYQVRHLKTAATSAMRDASNSKEILDKVKKETGIELT
ncbi:MAG: exopolyphosphatase, partial [Flavisolibacter sp.]